ncbi:M61 family metallopeptidase [Siphonobacter curvatus]|uniref:Peptidase M61 n=1 Tax=Siphonobacter curvatus TaxID=2094562 RepID=A0A2S7IL61_9BACT|nr:PDZ domain-containing protein [Siphonobacter curvatus]PQA58464.1 peptidase M61 [Siphonobacter curvatus]
MLGSIDGILLHLLRVMIASFYSRTISVISSFLWLVPMVGAQQLAYTVRTPNPETHLYHVALACQNAKGSTLELKMPVWTPGYYQLMKYASYVENFQAKDEAGRLLPWEKSTPSTWKVSTNGAKNLKISYDVRGSSSFVASNYLDANKAYISPTGLFLYLKDRLDLPVTVTLEPHKGWSSRIATGLDSIPGKRYTYQAANFDVLYDSPILMGKIEELPAFEVKGIPHYFVGYNMGDFDRKKFTTDLQKIVANGSALIGDIPYKHYTFIAIGPGGGGIEHLNSTSISFSGNQLHTRAGELKMYNFLAHEYFHHYNVKRIRPQELGPFNYDQENRTKLLWVSEGFTVYYEYLIVERAGLMTPDELFQSFQQNIRAYENKPGHRFQSATQSSYETWEDGPFGRTGDEVNKTISYYNKGPILGLILDFKIRHETQNKRSLDDVMRSLYRDYYQKKQRGFTEKEFRQTCEQIAGMSLTEVFEYAATVNDIDYPKYFAYGGLSIDTTARPLPGAWLGIKAATKGDSVVVAHVEYESPAWEAGLRSKTVILTMDGKPVSALQPLDLTRKPDETVVLGVVQNGQRKELTLRTTEKYERDFKITRLPSQNALQAAILKSWLQPQE